VAESNERKKERKKVYKFHRALKTSAINNYILSSRMYYKKN